MESWKFKFQGWQQILRVWARQLLLLKPGLLLPGLLLYQEVSEEGPKNFQTPATQLILFSLQAVQECQVWDQKAPEQVLAPRHKTAKYSSLSG